MGVEGAPRAASGFGRIGRDVLNAQLLERPTHLGQVDLIDFAASLRGVKGMAAPVGVRAAKQPVARSRLPDPVKTGVSALDRKAGFSVRIAPLHVSLTHVWRSEEFTTPVARGGTQQFLSINVSWEF